MSTVDNDVVGASAGNREIKDDPDEMDLPEGFFDEFEDNQFLDEIVEIVVPEQSRLIKTGEINGNPNETNDSKVNADETGSVDSATLKDCLDQINDLSKSIERREQRIKNNLKSKAKRKRRSHTRSPSPANNNNVDRNVRSRDRRSRSRRSPSGPRTSRTGSRRGRSRSRDRNRSRDRRGTRRDRSRSQSKTSHPRGMSFLEELEQKFAEKGQDFPEKDLLMRSKNNGVSALNRQVATIGYPQCEVPINMPSYIQMPSVQLSMYNQPPYQPYWNGNYMINTMTAAMPHAMHQVPFQAICATNTPTTNTVMQNGTKAS